MEMQMDMQYPGLLPQAYSSVAAPFAMVMPNHVHDMIGGYSIQHHPYGAAVAGLPPGGIKRRKKDGVRKGKWTVRICNVPINVYIYHTTPFSAPYRPFSA
jgi:hypothetical protein